MERTILTGTDLRVAPIAYGTWELGGHWGPVDEEEAVRAVRRAHEHGVTLFDTAQAYGFGAAERLLGTALRTELTQRRDEVVIATKGGMAFTDVGLPYADSDPTYLRAGLEQSLCALGVDHVDIYQVHAPDGAVPFEDTAAVLESFVQQGKARYAGVSNYDTGQLAAFSAVHRPATVQSPYSLFCRDVETTLLPHARQNGVGVLAYAPLAHGLLGGGMTAATTFPAEDWRHWSPFFAGDDLRTNVAAVDELASFARDSFGGTPAQLAIAWVLANPAVDVCLVRARRANHVEDAIKAADRQLTADDLTTIEKIMADTRPLPLTDYAKGEAVR